MTPSEMRDYFEQCAVSNRAISHVPGDPKKCRFFKLAIEDLESNMRSKFKGLSLVLEYGSVREGDQLSDNPYLYQQHAFWILCPIEKRGDTQEVSDKDSECYEVALQVYTKLRNDKMSRKFKGLDPGSFSMVPFINLDGTAVGYRCTFTYSTPAPFINLNDWNNETIAQ